MPYFEHISKIDAEEPCRTSATIPQEELNSIYASVVAMIENHLGARPDEQPLNEILEGIVCGVVLISPQQGVLNANTMACGLLGLAETDNADAGRVEAGLRNLGIWELLADYTVPRREFIVKGSQGKILKITGCSIPSHEPLKVVSIWDNTTKQLHEEMTAEFISSISHELRTPLTTIQNSVSNILAGVTGKVTPKTTQYLDNMLKDCDRLACLVNDLLDMAKLDAGKMPICRSTTELRAIVCRVVDSFREKAEAGQVRLRYALEKEVSPVYVDPQRIHQVLVNLVKNAIKFTPAGGSVTLSLLENDEAVVAVVEDTGIGIAPEFLPHVFNKFYQAGRKVGPGYNGCGLGLAICKQIVAAHGGKIWAESEPGAGSRFSVSLPRTEPNIMLGKHIAALAETISRKGGEFALMRIMADASCGTAAAKKLISDVASIKGEIIFGGGDLMLRTADNELMAVLTETDESFLRSVEQRIMSAAGIDTTNSFNAPRIMPITKIVLYPRDGSDPDRLVEMARNRND